MIKLYKKTAAFRVTCMQEIRVILAAELDDTFAPPQGSVRRVQVLVPSAPKAYLDIDKRPELIGPDRTYKMPVASAGAALVFHLLPEQWLIAAAHEGYVELSLIVEYIEET